MQKLTTYKVWLSFQSSVNTVQGGWFRPQTDFIQKLNDISMELWNKWTNEAEKSQEARDNLIFLLKSVNIITSPAKGNYSSVTPPNDFGRFATMSIVHQGDKTYPSKDVNQGQCDGWEEEVNFNEYYESLSYSDVQMIDNQRWSACLQHIMKPPTLDNPKTTQINEKFQVAPREVSVVVLSYYIRPKTATLAYTLSPSNRQTGAGAQIIFNPKESVDLDWPETLINEFVVRLGEAYGIFTREQFLTQVSAANKVG